MPRKKGKFKPKEFKEYEVNPNIMGVSRTASRRKAPSMKAMKAYIQANIKTATAKMKRLEKTGLYKASTVAQRAKSQLRMLYRKMDVNEDMYHYGMNFQNKLTSASDVRVLYNAIMDIRSIDTRAVRKEFNRLKEVYSEYDVDFEKSFNSLSQLSSDFHEIFAILTYNDVRTSFVEDDFKATPINVIEKLLDEVSDKVLTDKQAEYLKTAYNKLYSELDAKQAQSLQKNYGDVIRSYVYGINTKRRK